MRALRYSVSEAVASLWRGRRSSSLSIATIAAAILVLGGLLLVSWNVERVVARWADAAEMSVYLRDGASTEALSAVEQMLGESALVASYERVSKAEAVARFRRDFEGLSRLAPEGASPFPASFEVRMASGATTGEIAGLARVLEGAGGVDEVRFDQAWIARLLLAVAVARSVGVALVLVLVAAAALTVANVVQLACFARRDEIEIMHLVGAPLRFVRGPFVAEGVLQGGDRGAHGPARARSGVRDGEVDVRRDRRRSARSGRRAVPAAWACAADGAGRDGGRMSRRTGGRA